METKKGKTGGVLSSLVTPITSSVDNLLTSQPTPLTPVQPGSPTPLSPSLLKTSPSDSLLPGGSLLTPGPGFDSLQPGSLLTPGSTMDSLQPGLTTSFTSEKGLSFPGQQGGLGFDLSSMDTPLNLQEVQGVSASAFKEAYDFYKKNAVGDAKTREMYLSMLRAELAEYKEGEDGTKGVTGGLLKNFTDENYKAALVQGEQTLHASLKQLMSTKYPNFEAFKAARGKAAADLHVQLQNNVAYPELSEKLLAGLEELSTKIGLEFGLSDTEKEKEQLLMAESRKNLEQQKKGVELEQAVMHSEQIRNNLESERKLLAEQNERQAREWKSRIDLESKLRQEQIARDLQAGFEERAKVLRTELADSTKETMAMMLQIQKEARESQARLTEVLIEQNKQQSTGSHSSHHGLMEQRPPGLLTSLLQPVTTLVGNLLAPSGPLV